MIISGSSLHSARQVLSRAYKTLGIILYYTPLECNIWKTTTEVALKYIKLFHSRYGMSLLCI